MIRWVNDLLGTGPALSVIGGDGLTIIDVRDLVDKPGNDVSAVAAKIEEGVAALGRGERTVVCCDYGISRSNAIAAGILARMEQLGYEAAVRRVLQATGETEIKPGPLAVVRAALGCTDRPSVQGPPRVLVTGGSGFVGLALCSVSSPRIKWVVPTRTELDLLAGSTVLNLLITEHSIDRILHLANPRVYTSNRALGETLTMLRNVIDVCAIHDLPMIYISSWEVYSGYVAQALWADEALPAFPKGPYGEAKMLAETLIEHSRRTQGLECALVRAAPLYGAGSDRPKFIHSFIEAARCGRPITTHRYRNGDPALDLLHIDDLRRALTRVIETGFVGDLNLGTGTLTSTPEIARLIGDLLSVEFGLRHQIVDADVASVAMDSAKACRVLSWSHRITLREGLSRIIHPGDQEDSVDER